MKITFLIGNGFDVSMGIESSYSAFYESYCKKTSILKYINDFKENIRSDMKQDIPDEDKTWADFEVGLGKYTTRFSAEHASQFLDCYEDAQNEIIQYLKEQEAKCNVMAISEDSLKAFADSILNFYQEVPDAERMIINAVCNDVKIESRDISFLSFNYTGLLDAILRRLPTTTLRKWRNDGVDRTCNVNPDVIHVHGTVSDFPIVGVDADEQIANKELLATPQFREIMIKSESVNALGRLWHTQAENLIAKSRIVCVFGMSLGETDARWWKRIAQWLKEEEKRHLIIYWYDKNPPNGVSVRKQLEGKNRVIGKFLSYSQLNDKDQTIIKSRIHVIFNTNQFLRIPKSEILQADIAPVMESAMV